MERKLTLSKRATSGFPCAHGQPRRKPRSPHTMAAFWGCCLFSENLQGVCGPSQHRSSLGSVLGDPPDVGPSTRASQQTVRPMGFLQLQSDTCPLVPSSPLKARPGQAMARDDTIMYQLWGPGERPPAGPKHLTCPQVTALAPQCPAPPGPQPRTCPQSPEQPQHARRSAQRRAYAGTP